MVATFVRLLYFRHTCLQPDYGLVLILKDALQLVELTIALFGVLGPGVF